MDMNISLHHCAAGRRAGSALPTFVRHHQCARGVERRVERCLQKHSREQSYGARLSLAPRGKINCQNTPVQIKDVISVLGSGRLCVCVCVCVCVCACSTGEGTTYGKTYGILPVEAYKGDGVKERETELLCVCVCVWSECACVSVCVSWGREGGQAISDKKLNKSG